MKLILFLFSAIFVVISGRKILPDFGFPEDDDERGNRVIHGQAAKPHSAPYIVSLKRSPTGSHFCGGSLLSTTVVLTAAHCLTKNMYIVAGLHDRHNETNVQIIKVIEQIGHEKYSGGVGPYDIALLRLEKSVELNGNIKIIEIPTEKAQQQGEATLYGWGKDMPNGDLPAILQTVTTDLLPYDNCKKLLPKNAPIHSTNICSSSKNQTISACNGDSGGPLIQNINDHTIQVGVVSWGYMPCGQQNYPSVYTHTGSHLEWISKKMAQN